MAELNGYILLYRKLVKWGWYKDSVVKDLFLHLLLTASYVDFDYFGERYPAGTLVTTIKSLSADLGFSVRQIRTALQKLTETLEITVKTTNRFSVISVIKWADYQLSSLGCDKRMTNERQTDDKQMTNKNGDTLYKYKEKNKENNKVINNIYKEKENKKEKEIVAYLNEKAGTNYRATSAATQKHIHARLAEGYTVDDFMTVIDKKVAEWKGTKMEQYLRPETLFGSKFENYLNAPAPQKEKGMFDFLDDFLKGEDVVNGK